ncbi:MAG: helix-turn-helix domain-containing protein [bacterium]
MQNDKLLSILKEIGLSEDEANVYLSTLSLGITSVLKIARATNIKRTTIYGIIDSLKEKGLMRVELKGLKQFYVAENPERLEIMLERRKNAFSKILPEFQALYNLKGGESVIKYYTGLSVMQDIYRDTLKEIRPHEDYLVITNQEKWYNLDPNFALSYIEERAKLPIKTRMLFQDSPLAREHKKLERNFNEEIKILPTTNALNVDTVLLPEKLITLELTPPYMTVVIENKSIVSLHKEMFEIIWKSIQN